MAKQIASQIATNLTLDTSSARQSLKELTQEVKSSNNEAKILEAQYKASGDAVSASKVKYEGLTNTLDLQKNKIDSLKQALQNNNTETQKGKDLQAYLTAELGKAETQYNSYNGQLEKATQAYKYQQSGLADLNNELKHSNDLSKARVERLEAEGRTEEANKVKLEQLKTVQKNYTDQLEIQKKELDQLASSGDKSSDSYKRQQLRVEQMGAKLASTTSDIKNFNKTDIKPETSGISSVKDKLTSLDNSLEGTRGHFKTFLGANLIATGITNALQSVQSHISGIFQAGVDYNKQLQNINVGLDNFTNGNSKLSGQLKDIIQDTHEASGYALDTTTLLTKKSYGFMGKNVDKAKELSDAWINVGRSTGMSDEKLQASIGTFGKIAASGDITSSSLTKVNKSLPGFSAAMAQHMGITEQKLKELASSGKLSMEDLSGGIEEMSKMKGGTKGLENYQKTFDGFTSHFEDRYKSLSGKITESFFSSSNSMLGGLSKSLDGKDVDKAFNHIGDSANKSVNTVVDAFSKVFKGTNTTNLISGMANKVADSISHLGDFIAKHAGDIKNFFEMIKNAGTVAFGALKSTLKTVIPMLEGIFSFASKHPTTFKVLAGSVIAFDLALKGMLGTMKLIATVKGIKQTFTDFSSGLGSVKNGFKSLGTVMKANPFILIITAVVAVGAALYELYKHNAKFRDFVNGIFKSIGDFIGTATKAFSGFVKGAVKVFSGIVDFFKKDWKEILLFIVNPFAGAFALLYKHNDKFKKSVNDLVKSVVNFFKDMGKDISNIFNGIINFIVKTWQNLLKQTIAIDTAIYKAITGAFKAVFEFISDIFNSIYKTVSKIFNSVKDFIADVVTDIFKNWVKGWKSIFNFFGDTWENIKKLGSKGINSLKDTFDDILGKIGKSFSDTWTGIKDGFSDMWNGMKQLAGDGINAVIKIPNAGIDGINGLIHDFGGPKEALGKIPKVKFATGTGAIKELTHAVLNDGNDSPETGNKETIIHPNGKMEIVQGQNTERLLLPGTEILNAKETAMFMGMQGIKHFASGTGFWGSLMKDVKGVGEFVGDVASSAWSGVKDGVDKFTKMFDYISGAISDPAGTLKKVFSPKSGGVSTVMDGMAEGAYKKTTDQATDWWKSLWSLAGDAAGGGGSSELLSNAVKFGTGKPYVWGATGPDSFDCSGLVQYTLKQMGKSFPHYSGDQFNSSTAVSDPKAGDLAFFGDGGSQHVGIYSGNGKMFSAMSPGSNPNIGYADVSSWSEKLAGYHRVPGLKSDDDKKSNDNSMTSLIKGQVGGMFDWIKKFIMPTQESAEPAGDGVAKWTDDVKKALSKLGLSTSGDMVSKVLKQIQTESGGNAKAVQNGYTDVNTGGNEAQGLMQVTPSTFKAYALSGHTDIMNGYDNILAGLNYAKARYGSSLSYLGQGHGYANGGLITKNQMIEVGEGDKSEMIIPLDGMKSSRGFELLGKTAVAMAARDGASATATTDSNGELSKQIAETNQLLTGMAQLLQGILGETHASNEPLGTVAVDNLTRTLVNRASRLQN